ncbi:MAG: hypothetical protein ACRBN8_24560 [Nannocystales bacterium]
MSGASIVWLMALAAFEPAAQNEAEPKIVVRPLEVEGDVAQGWKETFSVALARGLARKHVRLLAPRNPDAVECGPTNARCWRDYAQSRDAAFVVHARISKRGGDYELSLELSQVGQEEVIARARQVCELCGLVEVGTLLEDVAGTLASKVDSLASASPLVVFESVPPGARLFLDGREVGPMPRDQEVEPGAHEAEAVLEGHVSQRRSFESQPGLEQTLRFELSPISRQRRLARPLGWTSVGAGLGAVVAGSVLVSIDEDAITSRCNGENVNSVGVCKFRRDTLGGGIALVSVGAAAVVTGVVLLLVDRRRTTKSRATLAPGTVHVRF